MPPRGGNKYKGRGNNGNGGDRNQHESLSAVLAEGNNSLLSALGITPTSTPAVGTGARTVTLQPNEVAALQKVHAEAEEKKKLAEQTKLLSLVQTTLGIKPGGEQAQQLQTLAASKEKADAAPPAAGTKRKTESEDAQPDTDEENSESLSRSAKQRLRFREKVTAEVRAESLKWEMECMKLREEAEQARRRDQIMRRKGFSSLDEKDYFSDSDARPSTRARRHTSSKDEFNRQLEESNKEVAESPDHKAAVAAIEAKAEQLKQIQTKASNSPAKSKISKQSSKTTASKVSSLSKRELRTVFAEMLGEFGVETKKNVVPSAVPTTADPVEPEITVEISDDDICAAIRTDKSETSSAKSSKKKKKKKPIPMQPPFIVLNKVLSKCKIPQRPVRPGDTFKEKFQPVVDKLTERMLKVEGVEAQLEGLFRDTYNYTVGTRSVSSLMLELVYIAERSNVKIPAAVFE